MMQPVPDDVLQALIAREPIFHRPEWGTARADFEAMMAPGFWEIGASGAVYDREFVLDALERLQSSGNPDIWEARDFSAQALSRDLYLLSYTLLQDQVRLTRRTTLWRRRGEEWLIQFHQGTLVATA
jgi:hypothetical protein